MPTTPSLQITTATTVQHLQDFLNSAKSEDSLHAKIGKDGSRLLYVSKGKGTGFKQALFPKKFEARKIEARLAILEITTSSKAERSAALRASIVSGYIPKELDEDNSVVEVVPLIVGELKSKISNQINSNQINLAQQALVEKYFKGIELDFDNGKARTPFSANNDKPLATNMQNAMEGVRNAARELSGSLRQELREATATFIKHNLPNCPFHASHEYEEIADFVLNFDRNMNKLLKDVFDGPRDDKKMENATAALADNFKKMKFIVNLFTTREIHCELPADKE